MWRFIQHTTQTTRLCVTSEYMSCTKAFNSKYGKGFGLVEPILGKDSFLHLPNPVFGIAFYSLAFFLSFFRYNIAALRFLTSSAAISCVMSVYLACILYSMNDFCIVCVSTYI